MAFPTTAVLDDFTRADENPLSQGGNWSNPLGGLGVAAFQLTGNLVTSAAGGPCYATRASSGNDLEAWVVIPTLPVSGDVAVYVRDGGTDATFRAYTFTVTVSTGAWALQRITNAAVALTIASGTLSGGALVAGDSIGIDAVGTTITGYIKRGAGAWATAGSGTDSTYTSGGLAMSGVDTDFRISSFGGGPVVTGGTSFTPTVGVAVATGVAPARVVGTVFTPVTP